MGILIAYHRWTYSYTLDLSCPKRKRLDVSKKVKYIAVLANSLSMYIAYFHMKTVPSMNTVKSCKGTSIKDIRNPGKLSFLTEYVSETLGTSILTIVLK